MFVNDATIFLPTSDFWILACLNSCVLWWLSFRLFPHKKDEALAMDIPFVEGLPVPEPNAKTRDFAEKAVSRLIELTEVEQGTRASILDWLNVQHDITEPNTKLQDPIALDSNAFVAEAQKARGKKNPLTAAGLRSLRDEYTRTIEPARSLAGEALQLEYRLHDLVNVAYGLTPEEVRLMWDSAPPRMPIPRPNPL